MRKVLTIIFFVVLVILAGCGGQRPAQPPEPEPEPTPEPGKALLVVYYVKHTQQDAYLVREVHEIKLAEDDDDAVQALNELISGQPLSPGASSVIPPETKILDLTVANSLATVNFSEEVLEANVGAAGEGLGIQSIVNTLTEFPHIDRVEFRVEGALDEKAKDWWGHIGLYEQPFSRDLSMVWEPAIWVDKPTPGSEITSSLPVAGSARVFEATVNLRLKTESGTVLAETFATATEGAPSRGSFDTVLSFETADRGPGVLEAFWISPKDGSEMDKIIVPVVFK